MKDCAPCADSSVLTFVTNKRALSKLLPRHSFPAPSLCFVSLFPCNLCGPSVQPTNMYEKSNTTCQSSHWTDLKVGMKVENEKCSHTSLWQWKQATLSNYEDVFYRVFQVMCQWRNHLHSFLKEDVWTEQNQSKASFNIRHGDSVVCQMTTRSHHHHYVESLFLIRGDLVCLR